MHSSQILAVLVVSASVQAMSMPSLSRFLARRQDPATITAPSPESLDLPPDALAAAAPDGIISADPMIGGTTDTHKKPGDKPPPKGEKGQCPPIWKKISSDLTPMFTENGQCNDLARGAIRAAFHDCGAWKLSLGNNAGCDGSLFLAPQEITRQENGGLVDIVPQLGALAQKYGVGMADFFQFAGGKSISIFWER
jgi:hypothetical protein